MKYIYYSLVMFGFICCRGDDSEEVETLVNLNSELQEGAWVFERYVDSSGSILIDGKGYPEIILFFEDDTIVKGRLRGEYKIDFDILMLKIEIDTIRPIYYNEIDVLGNYPERYYQLEELLKPGINGNMRFFENGWDSQIEVVLEDEKSLWLKRY